MTGPSKVIVLDPDARSGRQIQLGFRREGVPAEVTPAGNFEPGHETGLVVVGSGAGAAVDLVRRARAALESRGLDVPVIVAGHGSAPAASRNELRAAGADEVLPANAYLRDIVTIGRLLFKQPAAHRAHLVGNLSEISGVLPLVRALCAIGRSAVLTLIRGLRRGEVRFFEGEVTSAQVGVIHGQAALHQLLLWTDARFDFHHEDVVRRQQIPLSRDELLADAERFLAGIRESSGALSPSMVLEQDVARIQSLGKQIPTEVHGVLRMFDGHRVLADVLEDSPYRVFETLRVAQRAVEVGLLRTASAPRPKATWRAVLAVEEWLVGTETKADVVARTAADTTLPVAKSDGNTGKSKKFNKRQRKKRRANTPLPKAARADAAPAAAIDWGALVPRMVGVEVGPLAGVVPAAQRSGEIVLPAQPSRDEPREKLEDVTDTRARDRIFPSDIGTEPKVVYDDDAAAAELDRASRATADEAARAVHAMPALTPDTHAVAGATVGAAHAADALRAAQVAVDAAAAVREAAGKAAAAKAADNGGESRAALSRTATGEIASSRTATGEIAPSKTVTGEIAPSKTVTGEIVSARTATGEIAPSRTATGEIGSVGDARASASAANGAATEAAVKPAGNAGATDHAGAADHARASGNADAARPPDEPDAANRDAANRAAADALAAVVVAADAAAAAAAEQGARSKRSTSSTDLVRALLDEERGEAPRELRTPSIVVEETPTASVAVHDRVSVTRTEQTARLVATPEAVVSEVPFLAVPIAQSAPPATERAPTSRGIDSESDDAITRTFVKPGADDTDDADADGGDDVVPSAARARGVASASAPTAAALPEPEPADDRPPEVAGEIRAPQVDASAAAAAAATEAAAISASEPSILVADLQAAQVAVSGVLTVPPAAATPQVHAQPVQVQQQSMATPQRAAEVRDVRRDATGAFSAIEEEFFRAGQEHTGQVPRVGGAGDSFDDLDEGYQRVGFWDRLLGRNKPKR